MATYNTSVTSSTNYIPFDLSASEGLTVTVDNPLQGSSYITLESRRDSDGFYPAGWDKNTEGTYSLLGISNNVQDDYKAGFVVEPGGGTITFTNTNYISGSNFRVKGTGGSTKVPQFFSTWKTDNAGGANQIKLPLISGQPYDMTINWGDGTSTYVSSSTQGELTHVYPNSGSYTVYVTGLFNGIKGGSEKNDLVNISNWGNLNITNGDNVFNSYGFTATATDAPQISTTTLSAAFRYCPNFNGYINDWDVSNVTTLYLTFSDASKFNQPLDKWNIKNVSNVTYMLSVFNNIGGNFNQPLFQIGNSKVTSLYIFLYNQPKFNQPLNSWDVSKITNFGYALAGCDSFNQPLDNWDMSSATSISNMFASYLDNPDYVTRIPSFNQNLGSWNVSNVTNMQETFQHQVDFNNGGSDSIKNWNTSNVTNMSNLFNGAKSFNQPIGSWDTSNVTNMHWIFRYAESFNQPIGSWDTSKVTNFSGSFYGASAFDQDLSGWDVTSATNMANMFEGATLSTTNYDALLVSWASQSVNSGVVFHGGNSTYTGTPGSAPSASRATLLNTYSWTITDGGPA